MPLLIRPETPADVPAIFALTEAAFRTAAHSAGTEQFVVNALRRSGALAVSPVTVSDGGAGCMLVGDPAYYQRFGFRPGPAPGRGDVSRGLWRHRVR